MRVPSSGLQPPADSPRRAARGPGLLVATVVGVIVAAFFASRHRAGRTERADADRRFGASAPVSQADPDPSQPTETADEVALARTRLSAAAGAWLEGRVVDDAGRGVAGAEVRAVRDEWFARAARPEPAVTRSGHDGSFRLGGLGAGPFLLEARRDAESAATARRVPENSTGILLTLLESGVAGVVVDAETGAPIPSFAIAWSPTDLGGTYRDTLLGYESEFVRPSRRFDDPSGRFALPDLGGGIWNLGFHAAGHLPIALDGVTIEAGELRRDLVLRLSAAARIEGRVVDRSTGAAVEGALVGASVPTAEPRPAPDGRFVRSRADGSFALEPVSAGVVRVHVAAEGFARAGADVSVEKGGTTAGVVVALGRPGSIEGTVSSVEDLPSSRREILAWRLDAPEDRAARSGVDREGRFRLTDLVAGGYRLSAPSAPWIEGHAVVEEGRVTTVQLAPRGARLRGTLRVDGVPAVDAWIRIERADARVPPEARLTWSISVRDDGSFDAGRLAPGTWLLNVVPASRQVSWARRVEIPDAPEHVLEIDLRSGSIEGRVVRAADLAPVAGFSVVLRELATETDESVPLARALTDEDGRYRIFPVPEGTYRLQTGSVHSLSMHRESLLAEERAPLSVAAGAVATADFALAAGGTVVVAVRDPLDRTPVCRRVRLRPLDSDAPPRSVETDMHGEARFSGLPSGRYRAGVDTRDGGTRESEPIAVEAGLASRTEMRVD